MRVLATAIVLLLLAVRQASAGETPPPVFSCPELLGRPTASSMVINLVNGPDTIEAYAEFGPAPSEAGAYASQTPVFIVPPEEALEIALTGLKPDTRYFYRIRSRRSGTVPFVAAAEHSFVTRRSAGRPFTFDVITDSHIRPSTGIEAPDSSLLVLSRVSSSVADDRPDFLVSLGDNVQVTLGHPSGPMPSAQEGEYVYARFREGIGAVSPSVPLFAVIGNWDGENGWLSSSEVALARSIRRKYIANPLGNTYPEGGSPEGDYYAWTWGDGLFVVLNVMSYTVTDHSSGFTAGRADDWSLGAAQWDWLRTTLSGSRETWKFIFIHHTVGGNGSTPSSSNYGRGGGRAASVGEQAALQAIMREYGVNIFFYGHDHCFDDEIVDGIHYLCTASAGDTPSFCEEAGHPEGEEVRGHTRVYVTPGAVGVTFVSLDGHELRRYVLPRAK